MTPIPINTCCSTIIFPNFGSGSQELPIPAATVWTLRFLIAEIFITGNIIFTSADNPLSVSSIQAKINADVTYQNSGTTITVEFLSEATGLTVSICKASTIQIDDDGEGIFDVTAS